MSEAEKHLRAALIELKSAVSDLGVVVTRLAHESTTVSPFCVHMKSIEVALLAADKHLAATHPKGQP